ncbi:hypothetical protein [Dermatobacter hominis]|uniref:hypothetical protein n=1 Tax=Dermatobacter hominis TaxID=2884263 RepID=UPI001D11C325|nr:hypothetical protein [Dermatobacter hominis]UDY36089.1 hypothetical protein LH044_00805 [Dermatobacter hominis]
MALRRVAVSALGALVVLGLSACGTSPIMPPTVALSSPYHSSSVPDVLGSGSQVAKVRVCSVTGGPVAIDVHFDDPTGYYSTLTVTARSNLFDPNTEYGIILSKGYLGDVAADTHLETDRPLEVGECADVGIYTSNYIDRQGLPFTFTITW